MSTTEVKVTTSAIGTLGASLVLAIFNGVAADSSVLGDLPAWAQFIIILILPPLITFFSGYATPSTTSRVSDKFNG